MSDWGGEWATETRIDATAALVDKLNANANAPRWQAPRVRRVPSAVERESLKARLKPCEVEDWANWAMDHAIDEARLIAVTEQGAKYELWRGTCAEVKTRLAALRNSQRRASRGHSVAPIDARMLFVVALLGDDVELSSERA